MQSFQIILQRGSRIGKPDRQVLPLIPQRQRGMGKRKKTFLISLNITKQNQIRALQNKTTIFIIQTARLFLVTSCTLRRGKLAKWVTKCFFSKGYGNCATAVAQAYGSSPSTTHVQVEKDLPIPIGQVCTNSLYESSCQQHYI